MSDTEIPQAKVESETEPKQEHTYEYQKKLCLEAIKKINKECSTKSIILNAEPNTVLIKEIEDKGYHITYVLNYDGKSENKFICTMRITNPNINDPASSFLTAFEENMKSISSGTNTIKTEEFIKKLFKDML